MFCKVNGMFQLGNHLAEKDLEHRIVEAEQEQCWHAIHRQDEGCEVNSTAVPKEITTEPANGPPVPCIDDSHCQNNPPPMDDAKAEAFEPVGHAETAEPATSAETAKTAGRAETSECTERAETAKPAEPVGTAETAGLPETVEPAELAETADTAEAAETGEVATTQDTVTQIAPMILPDLDITDEAYAESTSTSYVTSIASEISRGILENERLYPQYGKHSYGMPIDEAEMDRMDLQHRKYEMVIGDRHFLAPIGNQPQRILDLATGTGIWALDVADLFPCAEVLGVDIAPIQPKWVAPNCQFEIDDIEDTWTYRKESFDFIHLRDPLYVVRDWPRLMRQAYEHTKPGGWCELASVYPCAMCDDGTMPQDSMFKFICDRFIEASYGLGAPLDSCLRFAEYLRNAGFVDVMEHIFKIPSSPWPKDKRLKKIGALELTNLVEGASAFGLRVFSHTYGWSRADTELAMVGFRHDVKNRNYHQYVQ
ncbi:hypothetical protein HRR80_007257 [Exophiala dermatitidis]|nr:hypothetical protein HRR73_008918 [Exophiala dermatitidis]KAJ4509898.1 hypothetical protein HRR74_007050 [Exophiala dermatitidis]KAJ4539546.1 hypothetical protein HRR77_006428 [Exophiala dermatitidis]KAJ4548372.1 hypothetical protein HRR76_000975 [Exophiala dermatitidis]KAJ4562970.1 hypothetical protein HRR79_006562 [Exophiala dermatitidis]